jgi:shikimate dehydrogenase
MRLFGLIGYPLSHSFSQKYFTEKFGRENIADAEYKLFPLQDISALTALLHSHPDIRGLNVTIPYKEAVIPYLDELDETAKAVGAVNCIKIIPNSQLSKPQLKGYNTDVHGFRQSIKPFLEMHHERALILGTGGASKAVHYVLKQIGIDCYFVSRDPQGREKHFRYEDVNEYVIKAFPLIVNTTPLGTYPNTQDFPPIPYEHITSQHLLYDLVYNPPETEFMKRGKARGAAAINGLSMLHEQAEKAWEIWNSQH